MLQDFMTKPLLTTSPQNNGKTAKTGGGSKLRKVQICLYCAH
jgi:hypothetical protein